MSLRQQIETEIANNSVQFYSKTYCGFCTRAKQALNNLGVQFNVVELDKINNGDQIQSELASMTGQRTVPNIFISNQHIGGCSELQAKIQSGEVQNILRQNNIAFRGQFNQFQGQMFPIPVRKANFVQISDGPPQNYTRLNKIGDGAYGIVYLARHNVTGQLRAIKQILKSKITQDERMQNEIQILRQADHPNIVKLYEICEDRRNIYMITEYCEGGELFDYIVSKNRLQENEARDFFLQILSAINYLHQQGLCHRDLKPENLMLQQKNTENPVIKLIDFGLARSYTGGLMNSQVGTPFYISPEVLNGEYNNSTDLWSAGVILFIMLSGYPPFFGTTEKEILTKVRSGQFDFRGRQWTHVSQQAKDLIQQLLQTDANNRLNVQQALSHEWFQMTNSQNEPLDIDFLQLFTFTRTRKLRKAVLMCIASKCTESDISQIRRKFMQLDTSNNGTLTLEQLQTGISQFSEEVGDEVKLLIRHMEVNNTQSIDYTEFLAALLDKSIYMQQEKLYEAFLQFDSNGDGKIGVDDLIQILGEKGSEDDREIWEELIREAKRGGEDEIDFNEFINMMDIRKSSYFAMSSLIQPIVIKMWSKLRSTTRKFSQVILSEDQLALKESAYKISQDLIAPRAAQIDKENYLQMDTIWPQLGEMGLLGVTCPEQYGGSDLGYLEHLLITEEISRASGSVGLSYIAHSNLCLNQIVLNGSEEQKQKYLPKLCSGEHVGALAMSEYNSGSDVVSMTLTASEKDGGYLLNGTKMWITNGPDADVLVVYAKTDPKAGSKGITAFLVEKEFQGFTKGTKLDKLGMRGSNTCELIFENCYVPKENILGKVNKGVYVLMSGLNYERLILSAGPIGLMQAAADVVFPYVNQRKQFNKKLIEFQMIQDKVAMMHTSLASSRAFAYTTAMSADQKKADNKDCASVFLYTSQQSVTFVQDAIQCLGGYGYTNEFPLGRIWRDCKLYEIGGGTNEIRKLIIAREIEKEYSD